MLNGARSLGRRGSIITAERSTAPNVCLRGERRANDFQNRGGPIWANRSRLSAIRLFRGFHH